MVAWRGTAAASMALLALALATPVSGAAASGAAASGDDASGDDASGDDAAAAAAKETPAKARPRRVLFTAFEPFGGSPVNNSEAVARRAAELLRAKRPGTEVRVCVLPVVYDGGAALARRCFESMNPRPELVISLGEGDCTFRLETRAHNLDHTPGFADNAGVVRESRRIQDGAADQAGFELPLPAMFCAIPPKHRSRVSVSYSPGNYVCNNAAFLLTRHLAPLGIPYGFIHVPHTRCERAAQDPEVNGEMLAGAVAAALDSTGRAERLPVSREEAQARFATARGSCEVDFFSRLKKRYF